MDYPYFCFSRKGHILSNAFFEVLRSFAGFNKFCFNPRPAGGAESAPPLLDFLNISKTVAAIDTKFGVPYLKFGGAARRRFLDIREKRIGVIICPHTSASMRVNQRFTGVD